MLAVAPARARDLCVVGMLQILHVCLFTSGAHAAEGLATVAQTVRGPEF